MTATGLLALIPPLALIAGLIWLAASLDRRCAYVDPMEAPHGDVPALPAHDASK